MEERSLGHAPQPHGKILHLWPALKTRAWLSPCRSLTEALLSAGLA